MRKAIDQFFDDNKWLLLVVAVFAIPVCVLLDLLVSLKRLLIDSWRK